MAQAKAAVKGDTLTCEVCGLSVIVDEACDCMEMHEIICCEEPMTLTAAPKKAKPKAARAKTTAKPKAKAKR
jgi:hypothetical protein